MTAKQYKAKRLALGYSQAELAAALGIHSVTISKRETGVYYVPPEAAAALTALQPKKSAKRKVKKVVARN